MEIKLEFKDENYRNGCGSDFKTALSAPAFALSIVVLTFSVIAFSTDVFALKMALSVPDSINK